MITHQSQRSSPEYVTKLKKQTTFFARGKIEHSINEDKIGYKNLIYINNKIVHSSKMFCILKCVLSLLLAKTVNSFSAISTTISTKAVTHSNLFTFQQRVRKETILTLQSTLSQVVNSANDDVEYELLSLPARNGRPLKVAIAGGGVGGLTTALCLLKKGIDVTVYEKTAAFARFGGPIQFASNALSVLKEIDDTLFNRIMEKFTFTGTRTCGIKDGLRADGSFRMTNDSLDYLWNPDSPADWFVKFPLKVCTMILLLQFCCRHFEFDSHKIKTNRSVLVSPIYLGMC
jgi:hypothetical protein